ncbi:hypothetical protein Krac_2341 [Ktedonobacter racemifer DSM 44963]|uniref:Uncharacterized protein n=1 Tax=Ktedonobacter racemifer DSM 44963 TaxID=485913 RepID=D6U528_KTERA|nr:hypothetical protein Krac_2341 [Ktedonobacter racemifer DSM 44963]
MLPVFMEVSKRRRTPSLVQIHWDDMIERKMSLDSVVHLSERGVSLLVFRSPLIMNTKRRNEEPNHETTVLA